MGSAAPSAAHGQQQFQKELLPLEQSIPGIDADQLISPKTVDIGELGNTSPSNQAATCLDGHVLAAHTMYHPTSTLCNSCNGKIETGDVLAVCWRCEYALCPKCRNQANDITVVATTDFDPFEPPGWPFPQQKPLPLSVGQEIRILLDDLGGDWSFGHLIQDSSCPGWFPRTHVTSAFHLAWNMAEFTNTDFRVAIAEFEPRSLAWPEHERRPLTLRPGQLLQIIEDDEGSEWCLGQYFGRRASYGFIAKPFTAPVPHVRELRNATHVVVVKPLDPKGIPHHPGKRLLSFLQIGDVIQVSDEADSDEELIFGHPFGLQRTTGFFPKKQTVKIMIQDASYSPTNQSPTSKSRSRALHLHLEHRTNDRYGLPTDQASSYSPGSFCASVKSKASGVSTIRGFLQGSRPSSGKTLRSDTHTNITTLSSIAHARRQGTGTSNSPSKRALEIDIGSVRTHSSETLSNKTILLPTASKSESDMQNVFQGLSTTTHPKMNEGLVASIDELQEELHSKVGKQSSEALTNKIASPPNASKNGSDMQNISPDRPTTLFPSWTIDKVGIASHRTPHTSALTKMSEGLDGSMDELHEKLHGRNNTTKQPSRVSFDMHPRIKAMMSPVPPLHLHRLSLTIDSCTNVDCSSVVRWFIALEDFSPEPRDSQFVQARCLRFRKGDHICVVLDDDSFDWAWGHLKLSPQEEGFFKKSLTSEISPKR